jgi:hypothetical protein
MNKTKPTRQITYTEARGAIVDKAIYVEITGETLKDD